MRDVYLGTEQELGLAGGIDARGFGRAATTGSDAIPRGITRLHDAAARIDWVPDLGSAIGSATWWRGLATCTALCAATVMLAPGFRPLTGGVPAPLAGSAREQARALAIAPLGQGADTGRRMAANDLVVPLAQAPERPSVDLAATLGQGDAFDRVLIRAPAQRQRDPRACRDRAGIDRLRDQRRCSTGVTPADARADQDPVEGIALTQCRGKV
ncbi:MAG: M23 family peptidase, partial [Sphingomonas sp.]